MNTIKYSEMRSIIERRNLDQRPVPFNCVVVLANRDKKSGGNFVKIEFAVKYSNLKRIKKNTIKSITTELQRFKDPNHWTQQTTNLAILARDEQTGKLMHTGEIFKIHYRSIIIFNEKEVEF